MGRRKSAMIEVNGKPQRVHFLNDKDGVSAKDYLLLISTGVFFIALTVGFLFILCGRKLGEEYFSLLAVASPVVITVVGGVMGVQGVETYVNRKKDNDEMIPERMREDEEL